MVKRSIDFSDWWVQRIILHLLAGAITWFASVAVVLSPVAAGHVMTMFGAEWPTKGTVFVFLVGAIAPPWISFISTLTDVFLLRWQRNRPVLVAAGASSVLAALIYVALRSEPQLAALVAAPALLHGLLLTALTLTTRNSHARRQRDAPPTQSNTAP